MVEPFHRPLVDLGFLPLLGPAYSKAMACCSWAFEFRLASVALECFFLVKSLYVTKAGVAWNPSCEQRCGSGSIGLVQGWVAAMHQVQNHHPMNEANETGLKRCLHFKMRSNRLFWAFIRPMSLLC